MQFTVHNIDVLICSMFTERGNFNLKCMHFCVNFPFIVIVFIFCCQSNMYCSMGGRVRECQSRCPRLSYDIHVEDKAIPK